MNGFGKQRVTVMGPLSVKVIAVNEYKNDLIQDSLFAQDPVVQNRRIFEVLSGTLVNRR